MSAIRLRDVPPELHQALRDRAARAHLSLRAFLLGVLEREAPAPSTGEWLAGLAEREPVGDLDVNTALDRGRAAREEPGGLRR